MATDSGQNSFRRGVMSLVILGLLKKEDMYGSASAGDRTKERRKNYYSRGFTISGAL